MERKIIMKFSPLDVQKNSINKKGNLKGRNSLRLIKNFIRETNIRESFSRKINLKLIPKKCKSWLCNEEGQYVIEYSKKKKSKY